MGLAASALTAVEAGADARYLKDALDKMLGCPAYLDSSTLAECALHTCIPNALQGGCF